MRPKFDPTRVQTQDLGLDHDSTFHVTSQTPAVTTRPSVTSVTTQELVISNFDRHKVLKNTLNSFQQR